MGIYKKIDEKSEDAIFEKCRMSYRDENEDMDKKNKSHIEKIYI
ncbi:hypothetical protein [Dorea sp.]